MAWLALRRCGSCPLHRSDVPGCGVRTRQVEERDTAGYVSEPPEVTGRLWGCGWELEASEMGAR